MGQASGSGVGFRLLCRGLPEREEGLLEGEADGAIGFAQDEHLVRVEEGRAVSVEQVEEMPHEAEAVEDGELDAAGPLIHPGRVLAHRQVDGVGRYEEDVCRFVGLIRQGIKHFVDGHSRNRSWHVIVKRGAPVGVATLHLIHFRSFSPDVCPAPSRPRGTPRDDLNERDHREVSERRGTGAAEQVLDQSDHTLRRQR